MGTVGSTGTFSRAEVLGSAGASSVDVTAPRSRIYETSKRCFDVVFSVVVLLVTAPVVLGAAAAIRIESPGNPFFLQTRLGKGGKPFKLVKLRGMYRDAAERFPEAYAYSVGEVPAPSEYFFHTGDNADPRVTRVGRFCRRYSIDELPNFVNVLGGQMSVVGPRPEIPELAHLYTGVLERFLSVRPGVTSPAKAAGRDQLSFATTLELELDYVARRSWPLDLAVIGRTIFSVLRAAGMSK